jgi:hypothetical protein
MANLSQESMAPREFFDKTMRESDTANPSFVAGSFRNDVASAYNFLQGMVAWQAEGRKAGQHNEDPLEVSINNIRRAIGCSISGVTRNGLTPEQQHKEALGVWTEVFKAAEIQALASRALHEIEVTN